MKDMLPFYQACLLGLAVGDAMGYTIDDKSWEEIRENYGPNGLLGYDLQAQEYAQVTSYTQLAAFLCNGLLLAVSRGKVDYLRYAKQALKEWTRSQHFYRDPEQSFCWLAKLPQFRRRHCRDARMLDNLRLEAYGTMANPKNDNSAPGAITGAVLGAKLGEEALPEFYLESLDSAPVLRVLAEDLACGTPALGLFDDAWDLKYVQGLPPEGIF